jgi:hypothetical protein
MVLISLEQSSSDFLLERFDLDTQRRLRHVKALSRTIKAALIRNHYEVFKLPQLHDRRIL